MDNLKALFLKYRQFLLYCVVGASNTLITMLALYLFFNLLHWPHWLAYTLSYAAGVVNGYIWSSRAVFRQRATATNMTRFVVVNLVTLGINQLLMWLFVDKLGVYSLLAQAFVIPFTFIGNYSLNKIWTFSSRETDKQS